MPWNRVLQPSSIVLVAPARLELPSFHSILSAVFNTFPGRERGQKEAEQMVEEIGSYVPVSETTTPRQQRGRLGVLSVLPAG